MTYTLGVVAFVVALLVSVMLHEAGHFLTARRYGMKATQFFVGFGPTLFSRRRGETEYGIKAIPAGGFVKIVGMTPLEELDPDDEPRAFYKQSAWRRTVVLAAGSTVHFVLTVLLVFAGTLAIGVVDAEAPVVSAPVAAVPVSTEEGAATVPAPAEGVLQQGDQVPAVAGQPVQTWRQVVERVRASAGEPLTLTVERDDRTREVTVTPAAVTRPSLTDPAQTDLVGAIGVAQRITTERVGLGETVSQSGTTLQLLVTGTWETLRYRLDSVTKLYSDDRDPQGLVGVVGAGRASGELLGATEFSLSFRVLSLVMLVAGLNFFVGVFNLLPLLPLDGGHIAVVWFESARDRLRRLRGYAGPVQRVDYNRLLPLTYAVAVAFLGLTLFIMGADIVNPISLDS